MRGPSLTAVAVLLAAVAPGVADDAGPALIYR